MVSDPFFVKNIIREFRHDLENLYPENEIMQILYILFEEFAQWSKTTVHLSYNVKIEKYTFVRFSNALTSLRQGKPIQYITGKAFFNGIKLKVTPDVLVPRPETEELCSLIQSENIQNQYRSPSILDIGTGSGCIAIDLKRKFPFATITGIDNSPQALEIATENAVASGTEIHFALTDILIPEHCATLGLFDMIVSNPPYVLESEKRNMHRNVIDFEPSGALFVPDSDPLKYYHAIGRFAVEHLLCPGNLYVEINEHYGTEVKKIFHMYGFQKMEVIKDFMGKERFVTAQAKFAITDTSYWYADKP
ncbi:MAG: peptide chain release factor N(5)-glutamine methyltransferase [Bacteroidota bacterium]